MRTFIISGLWMFIIVLAGVWGCSKSDPGPEPVLNIKKDIYYLPGDTFHKHTLDVYYKLNASLNDVVLFVPGGAWRQGDKDQYEVMATTLVSNYNYTVVVTNYRLSNSADGSAIHPDHIHDVASAFRWVMEHITDFGGNPRSVFLFGQSAGAHLVSLLATDEQYLQQNGYTFSDVRGVISMSGTYRLNDLVVFPLNPLALDADEILMYKAILAGAFGSYDSAILNPASPAFHINPSMPPFLLIYTELDMPGFDLEGEHFFNEITDFGGLSVAVNKLYQSDYSAETWQTATAMAAAEPLFADYIGHYAEVVAINEADRLKAPTPWIVSFIAAH